MRPTSFRGGGGGRHEKKIEYGQYLTFKTAVYDQCWKMGSR